MEKLIYICFISMCLFSIMNYHSVGVVEDVDDRNCVAIIDSKDAKTSLGFLHRTIVEFALRSVHGNSVRVVMHGLVESKQSQEKLRKEITSFISTTPCKVTSISMFSLHIANYKVKFRKDSTYVIGLGNITAESLAQLDLYKSFNGKYYFDDNVILVSGGGYSRSFSCGFIKHYTLTKCVIPKFGPRSKFGPKGKFEAGVIEYKGKLYLGSSFAAPVYAGTLLKAIMKNDRNNWYNW